MFITAFQSLVDCTSIIVEKENLPFKGDRRNEGNGPMLEGRGAFARELSTDKVEIH